MTNQDTELFQRLKAEISKAMDTYVDPAKLNPRTTPIGSQLPDEFFNERIAEMRAHMTDPHWIDVQKRDTLKEMDATIPIVMRCVALTKPEADLLLAYSPDSSEYLIAQEQSGGAFGSIGIWGDPVGCYASM